MYLEEFRDNDFDMPALLLSTQPPHIIYLNYNHYAIHAYQFTMRCLSDLENSHDGLNNGTYCIPAISMWYLSVDSFVNALLKVLYIKSGKDYQPASLLSLAVRFQMILKVLSIKPETQAEKDLIDKLEDIGTLYNKLSFDLLDHEKLIYKKASFGNRPYFVNQVDVLQSSLIAIEVFEKLRFVISGLDLMPNISLMTDTENIVFDKLGVLQQKVISPAVKDILSKHNLKVKLNLVEKFSNYPVSTLFESRQVVAAVKVKEDDQYKVNLSSSSTKIISSLHSSFMKKFAGHESKFKFNFLAPGSNKQG